MRRYVLRRLLIMSVQLFGVIVVAFFAIRLIPGDPALLKVGGYHTPEILAAARESMGLDKPVAMQFLFYVRDLARGDMGVSFTTTNPVAYDIARRLPITLELILLSSVTSFLASVPLGVYQALRPGTMAERITTIYGFLAGALPEFYIALIFIFIFFYILGVAPAPIGRIDPMIIVPPTITGSYIIDGILTKHFDAALSAITHLVLPIATMTITGSGAVMKMMRATMIQVLNSDYIHYAQLIGLPNSRVTTYAIRNALAPVVTLIGIRMGVLIGGAVLIETVFSLSGLGQYAVSAAAQSDYNALIGFLIVACIGTLIVLLLVDLAQLMIDPRQAEG